MINKASNAQALLWCISYDDMVCTAMPMGTNVELSGEGFLTNMTLQGQMLA